MVELGFKTKGNEYSDLRSEEGLTDLSRRKFLRSAACTTAVCALAGPGFAVAGPAAPVWSVIPNQIWQIGQPVFLDLADYVTDPDGDPLTFTLDLPLPEGVTLNGSVISGTPVAESPTLVVSATADDGSPDLPKPNPPSTLIAG